MQNIKIVVLLLLLNLFVLELLNGTTLGLMIINERQVGIVMKKFSGRALAPGHLIALNGEAGYQADTLTPGWHFFYWFWQYSVEKAPVIEIPQGEIGLLVAADGRPIPSER